MEKQVNGNGFVEGKTLLSVPESAVLRKSFDKLLNGAENLPDAEDIGDIVTTSEGMVAQATNERHTYTVADRKAYAAKVGCKVMQRIVEQRLEDAGILKPRSKK